jgi:hypothetical protein
VNKTSKVLGTRLQGKKTSGTELYLPKSMCFLCVLKKLLMRSCREREKDSKIIILVRTRSDKYMYIFMKRIYPKRHSL